MFFQSFKKITSGFLLFCIIYLMISLIANPDICIAAGKSAIIMCANTVIPSLFPFFICSGLFSALGIAKLCSKSLSSLMRPLFNLPGSGAMPFILGIVSGYPTGAACVADLYRMGECTKTEAERMLSFCNNAGPLFVIGVVGCGFFNDVRIGYFLYISHILSAIFVGLIFRFYKGSLNNPLEISAISPKKKNNIAETISNVVDNSISSMFKVCAFIILFSVFSATLPPCRFTPFIHSFFEITGGINAISSTDLPHVLKAALVSFFLAFSGISILFQVSSVITPCRLSLSTYFCGKLFHGIISFFITKILISYVPISNHVFANQETFALKNFSPSSIFISSFVCMLLGGLLVVFLSFLFRLFKKKCF